MKKKLEAELISIAHRILKIKNKSDIISLHQEAQKLYETLSVLRFVEDNFSDAKPTIGIQQVNQKISDSYENKTATEALPIAVTQEINEEDNRTTEISPNSDDISSDDEAIMEDQVVSDNENEIEEEESPSENPSDDEETTTLTDEDEVSDEEEKSDVYDTTEVEPNIDLESSSATHDEAPEVVVKHVVHEEETPEEPTEIEEAKSVFIPSFELAFDPKSDDELTPTDPVTPQFTFDDLLGKDYSDPIFVKAEEINAEPAVEEEKIVPVQPRAESIYEVAADKEKRSFSVNDRLSKGITIGLNDRIAFMKHLFGNSSEDYNRVLSQLLTFDTFDEAENFISDMVKPDYNNWEGKDEYSQRFMEIVERRFS